MIAGGHWWTKPAIRVRAGEGRTATPLLAPPERPTTGQTDAPEDVKPDYAASLGAWLDSLPTDIGTDTAFRLWDENLALFIDARPADEYEAGHIPGAFNVPPSKISGISALLDFMGPGDRIVVYCEGGSCDASHLVAIRLEDLGITTVHIDVDGYPGWTAAGHETADGPDELLRWGE
ncbi:MAG: rhodanese-like domain-containing protein [Phycisphaeraceae bacterium]|nr:rhodanese-like domain-containing protein [Phycisphaeraceae bacterium]